MRIAIDIRPLLEKYRSGVSYYAAHLIRALTARKAHTYALFCNARTRTLPAEELPPTKVAERHFLRYPNRLLNASFAFRGAPTMEEMVGGADIVYMPNLNFMATRRPLVVTVHDLSFLRYPAFFSTKQQAWHKAVDPERLIGDASAVVTVSRHTADDVVEMFGADRKRIHVVQPAAGPEFHPSDEHEIQSVRRRYGLPPRYFLALASLEPRKNVTGIIEAFGRADTDADLVIAGAKAWRYGRIFAAADRSPKRDRIRFTGYVDDKDRRALYSGAIGFVYPSFYEGFGMPPLEAMACGTPVIASHATSLGEVVGDAGLLVDPYSRTAIADAMSAISQDEGLRHELTGRGLERRKRFDWNVSAERLEQAFASIER